MGNASLAVVREMIRRLRALPGLPKNIAPRVAEEMKAWADGNTSAGVGPDGKAWPARADGSPAHVGSAVEDVTTRPVGTVALMTVGAPTVFRHFGARGRPRCEVLPGNIPFKLGEAIRQGAIDGWEKIIKRGGT